MESDVAVLEKGEVKGMAGEDSRRCQADFFSSLVSLAWKERHHDLCYFQNVNP